MSLAVVWNCLFKIFCKQSVLVASLVREGSPDFPLTVRETGFESLPSLEAEVGFTRTGILICCFVQE